VAGKTGRFAIVEQLLADGITYMFGNPGTVEQGFLDALGSYPEMRYITTLQETVAVAMADGPAAGLDVVDRLDAAGSLRGYYLLPATRADLLRRLGRNTEAASAYRDALGFEVTEAERRYLESRLAEVSA